MAMIGNVQMGSDQPIIELGLDPVTVLDIGACEGESLIRFRNLWPDAFIHSFEPRPLALAKLRKVAREDGNCRAYPIALGEATEVLQMFECWGLSGRGGSSILRPSDHALRTRAWAKHMRRVEVQVRRLDDVLTLPEAGQVFAKIDVQGYEARVLRGAPEAFARVDACLVEVIHDVPLYDYQSTFAEVDVLLTAAGLTHVGTARKVGGPEKKLVWADHIWTRSVQA